LAPPAGLADGADSGIVIDELILILVDDPEQLEHVREVAVHLIAGAVEAEDEIARLRGFHLGRDFARLTFIGHQLGPPAEPRRQCRAEGALLSSETSAARLQPNWRRRVCICPEAKRTKHGTQRTPQAPDRRNRGAPDPDPADRRRRLGLRRLDRLGGRRAQSFRDRSAADAAGGRRNSRALKRNRAARTLVRNLTSINRRRPCRASPTAQCPTPSRARILPIARRAAAACRPGWTR